MTSKEHYECNHMESYAYLFLWLMASKEHYEWYHMDSYAYLFLWLMASKEHSEWHMEGYAWLMSSEEHYEWPLKAEASVIHNISYLCMKFIPNAWDLIALLMYVYITGLPDQNLHYVSNIFLIFFCKTATCWYCAWGASI